VGAPIYTTVFVPNGKFKNMATVVSPCTYGTTTHGGSHIKPYSIGESFYEPFGETVLTVAATIHNGTVSPINQICEFTVYHDGPYVVGLGTEESLTDTILIGLPYFVMRIAAWQGKYIYGYLFLIVVPLTAALTSDRKRAYIFPISAIFILTSVNRWSVMREINTGFFFSVVPIAFAAFVPFVKQNIFKAILWGLALVSPTKSWVDIAALTTAYLYEWRNTNSKT